MAVRFQPPPGDGEAAPGGGRDGDLAEVIELRSLLRQRAWGAADGSGASGPDGAAGEARGDSEPPGGAEVTPGAEVIGFGRPVPDASAVPGPPDEAAGTVPAGAPDPDEERPPEGDAARSAYEDGVRLLARRARSSGELRDELLRLEHDVHEVEAVIDEFERSHYLDDLGLARLVTEKLRDTKRESRARIRAKLRERRLPDGVIEEALGELDDDEEFELLRVAAADRARRLADLDRQTAERRLLGFLARRGWSGERAARAAREALDAAGRPAPGGVRFR